MGLMTPIEIVDVCAPREDAPLFIIGPYANRVNFVAQQTRALNLVHALFATSRLKPTDKVAVIGGGIAGVTAAIALVGYGAQVSIIESGAMLLPRQSETVHRIVNPSITRWPMERLSETTSLRFLDWYEMPCNEIAQLLRGEYEKVKAANPGALDHHPNRIATLIEANPKTISVEVADATFDSYRAVIVALGFGTEDKGQSLGITESEWVGYWTPDNIVDTRNNYPNVRFIISGAGDGGMIDMLRVVHRDFDRGRLPIRVAALLEGTDLAARIRSEEFASVKNMDAIKDLDTMYTEAAETIDTDPRYEAVRDLLTRSYLEKGPPRHYLVDKMLKHPVSPAGSPINKLLIYHAIKAEKVSFKHGELKLSATHIDVPMSASLERVKCRLIVRHGPLVAFGNLINKSDLKALDSKQRARADDLAIPIWNDQLKSPAPLPPLDPASETYKLYRRDLATRYLSQLTRGNVQLEVTIDGYTAYGPLDASMPDDVFGVPLVPGKPIIGGPIFSAMPGRP